MTALIPMDPADVDKLPPVDLEACDHCSGSGAEPTTSLDPQDVEACLVCGGDGILPEYRGAA